MMVLCSAALYKKITRIRDTLDWTPQRQRKRFFENMNVLHTVLDGQCTFSGVQLLLLMVCRCLTIKAAITFRNNR